MTDNLPNYRELVHTPAERAAERVKWAQELQDVPGVPFGIPTIDKQKIIVPFHPGDMVTFCARPGHGKTSMLAFFARAEAKRILMRGKGKKECVVYVTWEQVSEEIDMVLDINDQYTVSDIVWGRVDMKLVEMRSTKGAGSPIYIIGDSLARTNIKSPRMYPEVVFQAIESIKKDFGVRPTLLCFDYIQLIPISQLADRQKQVLQAAHRAKEIAKRVGCPAVVAVQARREVDTRDYKMPGLWDAQWSSAIEQTADKYFSLWRPWLTEPHVDQNGNPTTIKIDGKDIKITPELLVLAMLKQRFAEPKKTWCLRFQPQYLKLCEMETDIEEAVNF